MYFCFERMEMDLEALLRTGYFADSKEKQWACLLQCACGLRRVHQAGFMHRDLKPQNVLCSRWGTDSAPGGGGGDNVEACIFKLADFGLVKDQMQVL